MPITHALTCSNTYPHRCFNPAKAMVLHSTLGGVEDWRPRCGVHAKRSTTRPIEQHDIDRIDAEAAAAAARIARVQRNHRLIAKISEGNYGRNPTTHAVELVDAVRELAALCAEWAPEWKAEPVARALALADRIDPKEAA